MAFLNILEWNVVYSVAWYCVCLRKECISNSPADYLSDTMGVYPHCKISPWNVFVGMDHASLWLPLNLTAWSPFRELIHYAS